MAASATPENYTSLTDVADGIAKAKAQGVYNGRPSTMDAKKAGALRDQGLGRSEIAQGLSISRTSVYRVLDAS